MKRAILIGLGLLMSLALVAPASAFVFVFADIEKTKDVTVNETIDIIKTADILVDVDAVPLGAAEAIALANQENIGSTVGAYIEDLQEPPQTGAIPDAGSGNSREATLLRSVGADENTFNTGIIGVNQEAGNMNNQGNNVALAVTDTVDSFANAEASASQITLMNRVFEDDADVEDPLFDQGKTDLIQKSINYELGIVGVNQSTGNMNNQLNNVAVAVGLGDVPVALSEADLGQATACNQVYSLGVVKTDTIVTSVNSNHGIVGVNQSAGNMDSQMNNVALSAIH
jgi:hypothetical protein